MKKLFSKDDDIKLDMSLEEFVTFYSNSKVVASEGISDFLYKIKDIFHTNLNTYKLNDRVTIDTYANKTLFLSKIRKINFIDIKDIYTSKPENFKGLIVKYLDDLESVSLVTMRNFKDTLDALNVSIGEFIHNYDDSRVTQLYGLSKFKNTDQLLETNRKVIAKYFPIGNGSTKAYIKDIYNSLRDFETVYTQLSNLDKVLSKESVDEAFKLSNETSNLIDLLIDLNKKNDILNNNDKSKTDLMTAVHIAAKEIEFVNYLYSNFVIVNGVFKNNVDDIVKFLGW